MQTSYHVEFELGDWSGDGHNQSESYIMVSNKPIEHLRELHFSCPERFGFEIGDICSEYEDTQVDTEFIIGLVNLGVVKNGSKLWETIVASVESQGGTATFVEGQINYVNFLDKNSIETDFDVDLEIDDVAELWFETLRALDPELTLESPLLGQRTVVSSEVLELIKELSDLAADKMTEQLANRVDELVIRADQQKIPSMHFYGFDEKERHLQVPGYGCFY